MTLFDFILLWWLIGLAVVIPTWYYVDWWDRMEEVYSRGYQNPTPGMLVITIPLAFIWPIVLVLVVITFFVFLCGNKHYRHAPEWRHRFHKWWKTPLGGVGERVP